MNNYMKTETILYLIDNETIDTIELKTQTSSIKLSIGLIDVVDKKDYILIDSYGIRPVQCEIQIYHNNIISMELKDSTLTINLTKL